MSQLRSPFDRWLKSPMCGGLHQNLFTAAAFLLEEGFSLEEAFAMLREASNAVEDRDVPDREIYSAIDYAHHRVTGQSAPGVAWPAMNLAWRVEILNRYRMDMQKLKECIPTPRSTLTYLHSLYRETDLLCIGKTSYEFRTVRLHDIPQNNQDLHLCEFINPSPMSSYAGLTESGDWSEHAKANTGPRVYGVIEFDSGEPHEHAAILKYLGTKLRLVMMVFSGGKSLHGWFKTTHATEKILEGFYQEAVSLGADSKMFSPTQFSRLPMGWNARTHKTQRVIYFNPNEAYYL